MHADNDPAGVVSPWYRSRIGCGLSFAQYEVMEALAAEPKLHAAELGRRLHITRHSAHTLLKQLERAGLIELLPRDGGIRCAWLTTCAGPCRISRRPWSAAPPVVARLTMIGYVASSAQNSEKPSTYR
jgi:hypothetical protein